MAVSSSPRLGEELPDLHGLHHVRLPVRDAVASRDWYVELLGFESILVEEEEDQVLGVVLRHPTGLVLGMHNDPVRAAALSGFSALGFAIADVDAWLAFVEARGVSHGPLEDRHLGRCFRVIDPDGLFVELHTVDQPSADEA